VVPRFYLELLHYARSYSPITVNTIGSLNYPDWLAIVSSCGSKRLFLSWIVLPFAYFLLSKSFKFHYRPLVFNLWSKRRAELGM